MCKQTFLSIFLPTTFPPQEPGLCLLTFVTWIFCGWSVIYPRPYVTALSCFSFMRYALFVSMNLLSSALLLLCPLLQMPCPNYKLRRLMKKNLHILFLLIICGWGMSIIILSIHPILQYNNYAKKKQKAAFNVRQSPLLGRPEGSSAGSSRSWGRAPEEAVLPLLLHCDCDLGKAETQLGRITAMGPRRWQRNQYITPRTSLY